MRYILILLLVAGCVSYKVEYRLKPITHYKDSVLVREYMLEKIEKDSRLGDWESSLIRPELMLQEEKHVYDSLMLLK